MNSNSYVKRRLLIVTMFSLIFLMGGSIINAADEVLSVHSVQQAIEIKGIVTDVSGEPIIGANVVEKGTTNGTITDIDGNFTLSCTKGATLVVSYIGYLSQNLSADVNMKIVMQEDTQALDEVVVVGYGVVRKRDLTGSVASLKSDDLKKAASSNVLSAMQAKIPGLDIQQSSGQAGSDVSMTLRGNRSISASNDPLILVDGVEYGKVLDIPASEIESMDVLKDASSTAIYGTKGANGVIIITTKRGQLGRTNVNLNSYLSFNSATSAAKPMYGDREVQRLMDAKDYKDNYAIYQSTGTWGTSKSKPEDVLTPSLDDGTSTYDIYKDKSYIDWIDHILQNSVTQNYEVSINGGNEKTNFNVAMSAMQDEGLMKNDELARYTARTNIDHIVNKLFKVGSNMSYTYKSHDKRSSGVYSQALKMTTISHAYLNDGSINATPNPWYPSHGSPLLDEVDGAYQNNIETTRFLGSAYAQITPVKDMFFKSMFTVDRSDVRTGTYLDYESRDRYQSPSTSYISNAKSQSTGINLQNTLNYNTNFGTRLHDAFILLGQELYQTVIESSGISGDAGKEHYYKSGFYDVSKISSPNVTTNYTKTAMLSFFGRLNYKFNEKYLLTASVRADGSSVLADGHKWGYFPSVALAWRMNEEKFLQNVSWINNLKLRASWGLSGNAAVNAYETLASLSPVVKNSSELIPMSMGNEGLTWEKTSAYNIGLDYGVLNGRISGGIDYYWTRTYDLLYYKSAPASSVFTSILSNVGETEGKGVEVHMNILPVQTKDISWNIDMTYSRAEDKLTKLADNLESNINGTSALIVGQPVSIYYDYKSDGNWGIGEWEKYVEEMAAKGITAVKPVSTYGNPGTTKIVDQNGDGEIKLDDDKIVYNRSPKHIFGMGHTFTYKDLSLSVQMYARLGGYINYSMNSMITYDNTNWGDIDYWTPENPNAKFQTPGTGQITYGSSLLWEKADYFKIKDITLSYNLPKKVLSKVGIYNARVYGSLKNYFTFSNIDNYDPERGGAISFPLQKQVVVGLNLQL